MHTHTHTHTHTQIIESRTQRQVVEFNPSLPSPSYRWILLGSTLCIYSVCVCVCMWVCVCVYVCMRTKQTALNIQSNNNKVYSCDTVTMYQASGDYSTKVIDYKYGYLKYYDYYYYDYTDIEYNRLRLHL